jgi:hypothetical protein
MQPSRPATDRDLVAAGKAAIGADRTTPVEEVIGNIGNIWGLIGNIGCKRARSFGNPLTLIREMGNIGNIRNTR